MSVLISGLGLRACLVIGLIGDRGSLLGSDMGSDIIAQVVRGDAGAA